MKDQTWHQEFQTALKEEQMAMREANEALKNDYIATERLRIDSHMKMDMEPSWSNQLDVVGMQPHSREYLERDMNLVRSECKFEEYYGTPIDYPAGIQFTGMP